jgi:hypothetical protein
MDVLMQLALEAHEVRVERAEGRARVVGNGESVAQRPQASERRASQVMLLLERVKSDL